MKQIKDLRTGDVIVQDGIEFKVRAVANLPDGSTTVLFEDLPATPENRIAYLRLVKSLKERKERENGR